MKPGDIIISHGTSIISKTIQHWTHSYWSHCANAISDTRFIEATWPKVREGHLDELDKVEHKIMTHVIPLTPEEISKWIRFLTSKIGSNYDWRGLLSFVIGNNVQKKSWYFCSELTKEVCELVNRPLLRRTSSWTTPEDIWSSLMLEETG